MASVGHETADETQQRLQGVLSLADMVALPGTLSLFESPRTEPPDLNQQVLAVIRDEVSWSALRPSDQDIQRKRFGVVSFHFLEGVDNGGFVGWLASGITKQLGIGIFVVCGSNTDRGGVYDYWGCPQELLQQAVNTVRRLAAG